MVFSTEKELRDFLRKNLKELCHFQPIETGAVASGVPDLNICFENGVEVWIELKIIKGSKMEIRPTQVAWHLRRARYGGRNFILASDKNGDLWLWHGKYIKDLMDFGIKADVPKSKFSQNQLCVLAESLIN